jgi:electron transport complex protein RnfB
MGQPPVPEQATAANADDLAQRLLHALPQTQCTRCGYPDCAAYAEAIAEGQAGINQCPPGGTEGVLRLAAISGQPLTALNPENGLEGPRSVAFVDEAWCIGCTLCVDACPTDAIFGTHKQMHTVIEAYCTGCELCLPVCPVDCIHLENASGTATGWAAWSSEQADLARSRYAAAQTRRASTDAAQRARKTAEAQETLADLAAHSRITDPDELARKKAFIEAAMARARQRTSG